MLWRYLILAGVMVTGSSDGLLVAQALPVPEALGAAEPPVEPVRESTSTPATSPIAETDFAQASPEAIDAQLEEAEKLQTSWLERLPHRVAVRYVDEGNDWLDRKLRLRLGLAYTSLGMLATDAPYGEPGAAAGDFDFFGHWRVWGQKTGNDGTIAFNVRERHRYTSVPPSRLSQSVGSPWNVTSGFSDTGFEVTQAYFDQYFLDRNVGFRIGKMFQDLHFDTYSYKSQKLFFLNSAFSDNPAVAFPEASLGFATLIRPVPDWSLLMGVGDTQERKLDSQLNASYPEKLFSGLELAWAPSRGALENHSFFSFVWFGPSDSDANPVDGEGITFTYEWQPPNRDLGLFARYAWSGTEATVLRQLATAGVVFKKPFGREEDFFGVAFGWGEPTKRQFTPPGETGPVAIQGRNQGVVEMFYRVQITPFLQLTPDVQLLLNPSFNQQDDVIAIFGLRARVAL